MCDISLLLLQTCVIVYVYTPLFGVVTEIERTFCNLYASCLLQKIAVPNRNGGFRSSITVSRLFRISSFDATCYLELDTKVCGHM